MSDGGPQAKRSKPTAADEEDSAGLRDALTVMDAVQGEIDTLNEQASEEILKVEQKFNTLRKPVFERRTAAIRNIEGFWPTSIINHPQLSTFVAEVEEGLLSKLASVEVEEFEDIKSGYRIKFGFAPNDFIENDSVTKEFYLSAETPHVKVTEVKWKPGNNLLEKLAVNRTPVSTEQHTFFEWLCDGNSDPTLDELAELIKDDLWPNPLQYFLIPDIEDDELGLEDDEGENGDE